MVEERLVFHIDVNSAYLSWEAVHRMRLGEADLREVPSIIGGDTNCRHGVVLAKSILAQQYGIVTGEPVYTALKKCPNLLVVPPSRSIYQTYSEQLKSLLENYFPLLEQTSIDEFFVAYYGLTRLYGAYQSFANKLKAEIKEKLGFTVNIGISSNKLLAKMASDLEKPDQVHTLFPEEIAQKMWPLPIERLFMVGKATAASLKKSGIDTIGQLAQLPEAVLISKLKKQGLLIWQFANGLDERPFVADEEIKSISQEITLSIHLTKQEDAYHILRMLAEKTALRLRKEKKFTQVIAITLKDKMFVSRSKQTKLNCPTDSTETIMAVVKKLFDKLWQGEPIRLLGVTLTDFCLEKITQMNLFEQKEDGLLDQAIDRLRERYGDKKIIRGIGKLY